MLGSTSRLGRSVRSVAHAVGIAVIAMLVALGGWAWGGARLTALEWSMYDGWLRARPMTARRALVVIARDPASEARLGTGAWDRAMVARLITGLARAGATAIGVDIRLGASAPARGGAASDALLSQATALAETVVYPIALEPVARGQTAENPPAAAGASTPAGHPSWPSRAQLRLALLEAAPAGGVIPGFAQPARAVGHTVAFEDADGVVRRVPLFVAVGDAAVPSLALALAAVVAEVGTDGIVAERGAVVIRPRPGVPPPVRIPVDARGMALVDFGVRGEGDAVGFVRFRDVWAAIEAGQLETLQRLVNDRAVLVLAEPARERRRTPVGPMSDVEIQTRAFNTLVAGRGLREVPLAWVLLATGAVASLVAWLGLTLRWWLGIGAALVFAVGYPATRSLALEGGLVLPVIVPVAAVVAASAGALLWSHLVSGHRIRDLEREIVRVQAELGNAGDALVRQESTVEALEEDLEMARVAVARSTGAERDLVRTADALREQLAEARAQEEQTRQRLQALEGELRGLRAVEVRRAIPLAGERERLRGECERMGIVTRDPAVLGMFRDLERAARASLPILITGEPGTGKELFARAAHHLSSRADRPFVAVNMAAIPSELFESELFGHVRGSFTGAVGDRRGHFEQAHGGTIFLDEVGDLRPDHQSKLLRVLQDKTFYRVGTTRITAVDVRVIAATNRDLERGIVEGWFREDLYFRLKGLVLRLPPLRERPSDIALLASRLLDESAAELGRRDAKLSEDALSALQRHAWTGNVRELQHCLRQAVALAEDSVITENDLRLSTTVRPGVADPLAGRDSDTAVLECLRHHRFDMRAAAEALGWDRSTVTQRLKGLGFRALVESAGDRSRAALALAGDPVLARTVELKLREYHEHLLRTVHGFDSADAAVAACRRRFKNLPERHFRFLDLLVRDHFNRRSPTVTS